MIGFVAVCLAIHLTGMVIAERLFERDGQETSTAERIVASSAIGIALWIATLWCLAITHQLHRRNLLIALVPFAIVAVAAIPRRWRRLGAPAAILLPIALWTMFILWRSAVVPPQNHDAMTYHLPKAALMLQAGGYEQFLSPDMRIVAFPTNYELLLSSVLLLDGSDRLTEWVGTAFYLLFLGCVAMVAERWWGRGPHVVACVLAAAGMPVLLLHSGADKNDLMNAVFACGALFWTVRAFVQRGLASTVLAILFCALMAGTKWTTGGLALVLFPLLVIAIARRPRSLRFAGFAVAAFLLLGGWVYVSNAIHPHPPLGDPERPFLAGVLIPAFTSWEHVWLAPWSLLRVCFGLHAAVSWPKHDLINSHFGIVFGLSALALPLVWWRYRREGDDVRRRERVLATGAALLGMAIVLPFITLETIPAAARYFMVLVPLVVGGSLAPLLRDVSPRTMRAALAALVIVFALEAVDVAVHDTFVPPAYLEWAAAHPEARRPSQSSIRAATYADEIAGPNDTIAFFGGSDGWVYPLFGRRFTRTIHHLAYKPQVSDVPKSARWLVVDWMPAPGGKPSPGNVRLMNGALRTGAFQLVYYDKWRNQAVLQRVAR